MKIKTLGGSIILLIIAMIFIANVEGGMILNFSVKTSEGTKEVQIEEYQRIIIRGNSISSVSQLDTAGCTIRHKLKDSTSYECPEGISEELIQNSGAKIAKLYHISDIQANSQINANTVVNQGYDGSGVTIIILDTGIDYDNQELRGKVVYQKDYVNGDNIAEDDQGHGTKVAVIAVGLGKNSNAKGVAPGAKIMMLKVCDSKGGCWEDDIVAALEDAKKLNGDIVSLSLGSDEQYKGTCDSDPMAKKANELVRIGKIVVTAAGNSGLSGADAPSCASQVISVGTVNSANVVTSFSARAVTVDILAPGYQIYSSTNGGSYERMTGTSASVPVVAGAIALLLDAKPGSSVSAIKNAIYNTAIKPTKCDSYSGIYDCGDYEKTNGVINVGAALIKLIGSNHGRDTDGDGTPDSEDLCPNYYGKDCNGCKLSCTGCAQLRCLAGQMPRCVVGSCASTNCPSDGCGKGDCKNYEWANFPTSVANTCRLSGTSGTCTVNSCEASCSTRTSCRGTTPDPEPADTLCWEGNNKYLKRSGTTAHMKQFCQCAAGIREVKSYKYSLGFKIGYKYQSAYGNNYDTKRIFTFRPVYSVMCGDGAWYSTRTDHYN